MDNLEKNISELMVLKNTARELHEACTSFSSQIDQAEERISEVEDQLNERKREGKMTEKRVKRNEQSLQEIWDYVKRPNLCLIGVPECDEENESKLENTLQDIIQENFPNLARQANIQVQEIQRIPQRYSSRRATPRHIIIRFTRIEMKEKMLRAAREKGQVTHKGKPIRLTADLSVETLQARRAWGPTFNILKEKNFQPRISYPAKLSFIILPRCFTEPSAQENEYSLPRGLERLSGTEINVLDMFCVETIFQELNGYDLCCSTERKNTEMGSAGVRSDSGRAAQKSGMTIPESNLQSERDA
ncbi:LINE-1 retrotransposable element ORF1 protein, partial [Plecturocebus cupreus]